MLITRLCSPLVFLGGFWVALLGLTLWGVGYATQDTLLKALIASVLPKDRRDFAFGVFYIGYGSGWLIGSTVTGVLYDRPRLALIVFAAAAQLASIPFFSLAARETTSPASCDDRNEHVESNRGAERPSSPSKHPLSSCPVHSPRPALGHRESPLRNDDKPHDPPYRPAWCGHLSYVPTMSASAKAWERAASSTSRAPLLRGMRSCGTSRAKSLK